MKIFALLFTMILSPWLFGQGFIAAVENLPSGRVCEMELMDGTIVKGSIAMATIINGYLSSITIKDESGEKFKQKAEFVKWLKVRAGADAKMDMIFESTESISTMVKADFSEIVNREWIIYERALLPKKKDKYRLMQLVNPGFDSRIKVFDDPSDKETMGVGIGDIQLTGGVDKTYLYLKR